jgi:hypothetical protein
MLFAGDQKVRISTTTSSARKSPTTTPIPNTCSRSPIRPKSVSSPTRWGSFPCTRRLSRDSLPGQTQLQTHLIPTAQRDPISLQAHRHRTGHRIQNRFGLNILGFGYPFTWAANSNT